MNTFQKFSVGFMLQLSSMLEVVSSLTRVIQLYTSTAFYQLRSGLLKAQNFVLCEPVP